ncbi:MAG: magnesium transporter [archaeon]
MDKKAMEFEELFKLKKHATIKKELADLHPADIAAIIDHVHHDFVLPLFLQLNTEQAANVIVELTETTQRRILSSISKERIGTIVKELESDDAADLVMSLPEKLMGKVLEKIPHKDSSDIKQLIKYPEDTAGGMMQVEAVTIQVNAVAAEAIEAIRAKSGDLTDLHHVWVVDKNNKVKGVLSLRRLLLARSGDKVSKIMHAEVISVVADMDRELVAENFRKYDLIAMPVVDKKNMLLGRITVDDVMDAIEEETTEDMYRLAGLGSDESVLDGPHRSIARRLPWLLVNLGTAILAAIVVGLFEATIAQFVFLAVFMPIIAGMGGNAGTQTLTVVVRGMALGELDYHRHRRVLIKEMVAALGNGAIVGLIMAIVAYFWKGIPLLGLIIFLAMVFNMVIAATVGTVIPITLKRLKIDPALASGILVTTFTDTMGFFVFLGLATVLFRIWL